MPNTLKSRGAMAVIGCLASALATGAIAETIQCYPYDYKAYSPATATPYKTQDEAHAAAIVVWEADILKHLGTFFADWSIASDRALDCAQQDDGYGGYLYICNVVGYPCYKAVVLEHPKPPAYDSGYKPPKKSSY